MAKRKRHPWGQIIKWTDTQLARALQLLEAATQGENWGIKIQGYTKTQLEEERDRRLQLRKETGEVRILLDKTEGGNPWLN